MSYTVECLVKQSPVSSLFESQTEMIQDQVKLVCQGTTL